MNKTLTPLKVFLLLISLIVDVKADDLQIKNGSTYCTPSYTFASCSPLSNDFINGFSTAGGITNISNIGSGCSNPQGNPNYYYYAGNVLTIDTGATFSFTIENNAYYGETYGIWIDFNNDGFFDPYSEEIFSTATTLKPGEKYSDTFTIPNDATVGLTRMRVRCFISDGTIDPCANYEYGETEDYDVVIGKGIACNNLFKSGIAVTTTDSTCINEQFHISLTNFTNANSQTFQWQASTNNATWTNIVGAIHPNLTTTQRLKTFYRCLIKCGATLKYSTTCAVAIKNCIAMSTDTISLCGSVFVDSHNKSNYENNEHKTITFFPSTKGTFVKATFTKFSTKGLKDVLSIFNGKDTLSTLFGRYYGTNIPTSFQATNVSGALTFSFISDSIGFGEGWSAYINCISNTNCAGTPTAGNAVATDSTICKNDITTLFIVGNSFGNGTTFQWQSSKNGINFTDIPFATNATLNKQITDTIYFRCKLSCSSNSSFTSIVKIKVNSFIICYCGPNTINDLGGSCDASVIDSVKILTTTFSNSNKVCVLGNYGAYSLCSDSSSNTKVNLEQLATYQLSITTNDNSIISVWIDYNQNGEFEPIEWKQVSVFSIPNVPSIIPVTIPLSAVPGKTGMRIRTRSAGSINGASDACSYFFSGETEDYVVTIIKALPCNAPPTGGAASANITNTCPNTPINLSLIGNSNGIGQKYQWQQSINGKDFFNLTNDTNTFTTTIIGKVSTYYRCSITCSGMTVFSKPTLIKILNCFGMNPGKDTSITACSGYFFDSGFNSNGYQIDEIDTITFIPSSANSVLEFDFKKFDVEDGFDSLSVYDGLDSNAPFIGTFTGKNIPTKIKASNKFGALTFIFISDFLNSLSGWEASFACVSTICNKPMISATGPLNICKGDTVQLNSDISTITWLASGTTFDGSSKQSISTNQPGTYQVKNNSTLCIGEPDSIIKSTAITVSIVPKPAVAFTSVTDTTNPCSGTILFTNSSLNATNYAWHFGDTSFIQNTANPMHTYSKKGVYNVKLMGKNQCESDSITQTINVTLCVNLEEQINGAQLVLFPNPTHSSIHVNSPIDISTKNYSIQLISIDGLLIYTNNTIKKIGNNSYELDMTSINSGIYFLHINSESGQFIQKIIKY